MNRIVEMASDEFERSECREFRKCRDVDVHVRERELFKIRSEDALSFLIILSDERSDNCTEVDLAIVYSTPSPHRQDLECIKLERSP